MADSNAPGNQEKKCMRVGKGYCGSPGAIYGFAFIGAAVYFIQRSTTFWDGVLGFLKAIVWPAMVIYKLLEFLKM